MAKPIRSFEFNFVPMPVEIWDECVSLSLSEFRFLGYLCKQIRFGEALRPITDEEMMHGVLERGKRKDQGCGLLSRNGIKQAREALAERGWVEAINVSNDPTRPRWNYRLLLVTKGETAAVPVRQLVSQRDTVTTRPVVSRDDSAVSQHDSGGVTARQLVSSADTCNKEEESTKNLDKELESKKAKIKAAPVFQTTEQRQKQANLDTWDLRRLQDELKRLGEINVGSGCSWESTQKTAAFRAGLSPDRHIQLLKKFFPNDPEIDQLYAPPPLFAEHPEPEPPPLEEASNLPPIELARLQAKHFATFQSESEDEIRQTIERSLPALSKESA